MPIYRLFKKKGVFVKIIETVTATYLVFIITKYGLF